MERVLLTVSIWIPKHVTDVLGGTNFFMEMFKPSCDKRCFKKAYEFLMGDQYILNHQYNCGDYGSHVGTLCI